MRENKILKYLENYDVVHQNQCKCPKGNCLERELECLKKEQFSNFELEYLLKYYSAEINGSSNTMTNICAIATLMLTIAGNILNTIFDYNTIGNVAWSIAFDITKIVIAFLPGILVCIMLLRTIKASEKNPRLHNRIMAIELLLAMNKEN